MLPFTAKQFFEIFGQYNLAIWPLQIVLYLGALLVIILLFRSNHSSDKIVSTILALFWIWMGVVYHLTFFSQINPIAKLFGVVFVIEGLLIFYEGVIKEKLLFSLSKNINSVLGLTFMVFGTLVYPLIGYSLGHRFPNSPTFGLPCPTTIFTLGVFLMARNIRKYLVVVPFIWSVLGFTASFLLGVKEDVFLLISGLIGVAIFLFEDNIFTTWGSKFEERYLSFTADKFVKDKNGEYFRAVDINAPADLVYRWICQMKLAPYSYDNLDNKGNQSPQHLTPGIEKLKKGDKMMTIFHVERFIPNSEVTLVMDYPPKPYDKFYVPTAITYKIFPSKDDLKNHCRVVVKYVANWKKTFLGNMERLFIIFADFIMMRRQLLNFKKLAERDYLQYEIVRREGKYVF